MSNRGMHVATSGARYGFADFGFGTCALHAQPQHLVMTFEVHDPTVLNGHYWLTTMCD